MNSRRKIKANPGLKEIFINEDLTQKWSALLYKAQQLKKMFVIGDAWTVDGLITIKTLSGHVRTIADKKELEQYIPKSHNKLILQLNLASILPK